MKIQPINETNWNTLTSDEFDEIDSQVRSLNDGKPISLADYVENFCSLANKAALEKNGAAHQ